MDDSFSDSDPLVQQLERKQQDGISEPILWDSSKLEPLVPPRGERLHCLQTHLLNLNSSLTLSLEDVYRKYLNKHEMVVALDLLPFN